MRVFASFRIHKALATSVVLSIFSGAIAQTEWPRQKSITLVVAHGPGSSTDTISRLVASKMSASLGQNVVAENRPGAGGNIASVYVKRAAPDGYTVLVNSVSFAVNPGLFQNAGYDAIKDFVPVALGPKTPNIITVHPSVPVKNLEELIALAKKQPLNYASSGIGTTTHLSMERLKFATNSNFVHVPYQPAQAVAAAIAGHTPVSSTSMPPAVPHVKAGRLKAIAVTSAQRSPVLPDVATVAGQGFVGFDDLTWFGFLAPAGTAPDVVNRLNFEINKALEASDTKASLGALGFQTQPGSAAEFSTYLRSEVPKWSQVVKDSGAKAE